MSRSRVTVVLADLPESIIAKIVSDLRERAPEIQEVAYVSKADGLKKLADAPGFHEWGMWMTENPVPAVLLLRVSPLALFTDRTKEMFQIIRTRPGVDLVIGEIPAIRQWLKLVWVAGGLLVAACVASAWAMWAGFHYLAIQHVLETRTSIQKLKWAGTSPEVALEMFSRPHTKEWWVCALASGGALTWISGLLEASLRAMEVSRWGTVAWACVVVIAGGWWMSRAVWRRVVRRAWDEFR